MTSNRKRKSPVIMYETTMQSMIDRMQVLEKEAHYQRTILSDLQKMMRKHK